LLAAIYAGHLPIIEVLLLNGANPDTITTDGQSPLLLAVERNTPGIVALLLDNGGSIGARMGNGDNALGRAASLGLDRLAAELIARGADPNHASKHGQTPLMLAARGGHIATLRLLLKSGAEVNTGAETTGNTALMFAANLGYLDIVEILLGSGADPSIEAHDGWTAMQAARAVGANDIVQRLENAISERRDAP
ncbi:MAG: ankyrin repeat domain-containing protein, partial [Gammaproteobacteria bacterium]|nr:ankyrin repeat domain-containing protein [Gammaproteobacteria bacterium]